MKEIPILFSTAMVHATIAGRKTQTRRVVKPQPDDSGLWNHTSLPMALDIELEGWWGTVDETGESKQFRCPYGKPGDLLWVRETFTYSDTKESFGEDDEAMAQVLYKASNDLRPDGVSIEEFGAAIWVSLPEEKVDDIAYGIEDEEAHGERWKPSIHMPKAYARIWLRITEVRLERLQDITEEDAKAEGYPVVPSSSTLTETGMKHMPPKNWFSSLWCRINGNESWSANPWVWVVKFEVVSTTGKDGIKP